MTDFLRARGLSCIRQDRVLFQALDLELSPGQLLQIQGKNGAGKSSLLRLLAGLSTPDDGEILFQGQPLAVQAEHYAASLCYIGHHSGIHEQLTAMENIAFWRAAYQLPYSDSMQLLGSLGLAGLEDVPCRMLSAGQQRRVSLARLWLTKAPLWILDEPFTALDQQAIQRLQQCFHQHLAAEGAIIVTTHQALSQDFPSLRTMELAYRW
ncbi:MULTISPECIES: cytochrome c biogenesis heme-transporting ATPase CcmA [Alkalimonas]|uniref:Cytochrome c biogenesis heme-transporting ATPase CcmA n=1 Tax=Alkalimonas mucilaginosa TaxID=3057676 RepID=A0ABU7JHC4_9GAMM|nr:cytochrome c biogenesis heme-transporting ATPase CcmA [Alkalimonas sp. MEB004]MEE2025097.1 cytochrome c biogenesis heme-transporting ATPase CcmA [Alkalimonas sp. MEB004]